jgi:hypothetical protein
VGRVMEENKDLKRPMHCDACGWTGISGELITYNGRQLSKGVTPIP